MKAGNYDYQSDIKAFKSQTDWSCGEVTGSSHVVHFITLNTHFLNLNRMSLFHTWPNLIVIRCRRL